MRFGNFSVEAIDTAVLLDEALLAGVEGVAIRAGINLDLVKGGTSREGGAAGGADDGSLMEGRVDILLHSLISFRRTAHRPHREREYNRGKGRAGQQENSSI